MGEKLETQIFCGFCQCGEKYFLVFYHSDQNWEVKKKRWCFKAFQQWKYKRNLNTRPLLASGPQGSNTDSSCHSITALFWFWGLVLLIGGGFLVWFWVFLSCLLLSLRHRATPAGYKLWWARSATLRAQNPFLIWQEIIWIHQFFFQYMKAAEFTVTSSWSPSKHTAQSTAFHA